MKLLELTEQIIQECYSEKTDQAYNNIQSFIDNVSKENELCDKMLPIFRIIIPAIEKRDLILLGDCFDYGIKPVLQGNSNTLDYFNDNLLITPEVKEKVYYINTYSEEPALCVKDNNGTIHRMNSIFSPINEGTKWIEGLNMKKTTPAVCLFGLGTGVFAMNILNTLKKDGILVIYEPVRDIFEYCMASGSKAYSNPEEKIIAERLQMILKDKRVFNIVDDEDGSAYYEMLSLKLDYTCMKGLVIAKHNNYDLVFPQHYLSFCNAINKFSNELQTRINVEKHFKENYAYNFCDNINCIKEGILVSEIGRYLPKDIPVIIVSAGPSLNKNISILQQAKGHMLIVAVDSALTYLIDNGIVPDITITIDPNKAESCFSKEQSLNIPCILSLDANPRIVNRINSKKFIVNISNDYADGIFKAIGKRFDMLYSNGGSVATAVFSIFLSFGQNKIILVGQDLAFDDGKSHAGGKQEQKGYKESLVDGINGGQVTTRSDWLVYLKWFEKSIRDLKGKNDNVRIIDATEGGALIHGTEVMTLQEAIDGCKDYNGNLPNYNLSDMIKKMNRFLSSTEYEALCNTHKSSLSKLEDIEKKSEEVINICNGIIEYMENGNNTSEIKGEKIKLQRLEKYVFSMQVISLINKYIEGDVVSDMSDLLLQDGSDELIEKNKIIAQKLKFEAIKNAAQNMIKHINGLYNKGI